MATSSIMTNIKIHEPEKIESFIKALDASAADSKREPTVSACRQMTNIAEIQRLMSQRCSIK